MKREVVVVAGEEPDGQALVLLFDVAEADQVERAAAETRHRRWVTVVSAGMAALALATYTRAR